MICYLKIGMHKLKRGFKKLFNNTVFKYLREQTLNLNMQYFRDTQKALFEITSSVGYATPQYMNNGICTT